jgi:PAS domain-containing protein
MRLQEISIYLGLFTAALVAIHTFWKIGMPFLTERVWKPIRERITTPGDVDKKLDKLVKLVENQSTELQGLKKFVLPNGGTSVSDRLGYVSDMLQAQDALMMAYMEHPHQARLRFDVSGYCTHGDGTFMRWTGSNLSELIGWGWVNFIDLDQRDDVRDEWSNCIEEKRDFHMDITMLNLIHGPFEARCSGRVVRDTKGQVTGWVFHFFNRESKGGHERS